MAVVDIDDLGLTENISDLNKNVADLNQRLSKFAGDFSKFSQSRAQDERRGSGADWRSVGRSTNPTSRSAMDGVSKALVDALGLDDVKTSLQKSMAGLAEDLGVEFEDLPGTLSETLTKGLLDGFKQSKFGSSVADRLKKSQDKWMGKSEGYFKEAGNILKTAKLGEAGLGAKAAATVGVNLAKGAVSSAISAAGGPAGIALTLITTALAPMAEAAMKFFKGLSAAANRDSATRKKMEEEGNKRLRADIESIVKAPFETLQKAAQAMYDAWDSNLRIINQTQGYSKEELQTLIGDFATRIRKEGLESVVSASDLTNNLGNVLKSGLAGEIAEEFAYIATKLNAAIPTEDFFQYSDTYAALIANAIKDGKSQSEAIGYANEQLEQFASNVLYASRQITGGISTGLKSSSDLFQKAVQISMAARSGNVSNIAGTITSISAITGAIAPDLASSIIDAVYNAAVGGNSSQIVALRSLAGINASNTEFLQQFASNPQKVFSDLFNRLSQMQNMSTSNYMEVAEGLSKVFGLDMASFARVDFSYLAKAIDNMTVSSSSLDENMKQLASGESTLTAEQLKIRQINEYMMNEGLAYVLDNEVARSIQEHMWQEQIAIESQEATYAVELKGAANEALNLIKDAVENIINILTLGMYKASRLEQTVIEMNGLEEKVKEVLEAGKIGSGDNNIISKLTTYGKKLDLTNSYVSMLKQTASVGSVGYSWSNLGKSTYASLGATPSGREAISKILSGTDASKEINLAKMQNNLNRMLDTMSDFFGDTLNDTFEQTLAKETDKLARNKMSQVTEASILARTAEYLANPEKYGISDILYSSRLANSSKASGLSGFGEEVAERAFELTRDKVKRDLLEEAKTTAADQAFENVMKMLNAGKLGQSGYQAWADTASKFGISDLLTTFEELGYQASDVQNYFRDLETQQSVQREMKRQKDEEKFWEETQNLLKLLNSNMYDVFDKGDVMGVFWPGVDSWLADIDSNGTSGGGRTVGGSGFRGEVNAWFDQVDSDINIFHEEMIVQFKEFRKDWTDYYIKHTTYTSHLTGTENGTKLLQTLDKVQNQKDKTTEDVLNALTDALMNNPVGDLLDPTVQQNMLLAAILQGVQAIVQQNNTQGKLKLPDAISALATGMTVSDNTSASASTAATGTVGAVR